MRPILSLFLDSGLRCAELIGLRMADLHLEDGWLKVMGKGPEGEDSSFRQQGYPATPTLRPALPPEGWRCREGVPELRGVGRSLRALSRRCFRAPWRTRRMCQGCISICCAHTFATTYLIGGGR